MSVVQISRGHILFLHNYSAKFAKQKQLQLFVVKHKINLAELSENLYRNDV